MNYFTKNQNPTSAGCKTTAISVVTNTTFVLPGLMKRWLFLLMVFVTVGANAQVTVINPGNTTPALSATYTSLALAITDVNNRTAISGPVTITLSTAQIATAGGYVLNNAVITGGSNTNRFIFDGGGNTITAGVGTSTTNDAIFKIVGSDFITLQNFVMTEAGTNTTTTTQVEWGVALLYASLTNGAQNNIIQNNTITLNRTNLNTFGIYSNTRHSATSVTATAEVTSAAGSNSGNKIYGNTISNVNYGIVFIGAGTTIAAIDNGNDIGGSSAATGNTITNWGGGAAPGSYTSLTGSNYCIFDNQQINDNVSYNTITSAALTNGVTTGGILKNYSIASPTSGTITSIINNNTVQITNNPTGAAISIIGINNQGLTPLLSTATMSMNNNTVQNCVLGGTTATTAGLTAITNLSLPGTMNMIGNNVINNAITATSSTSGTIAGVTNSGAAGTVNINTNIVRSFASTATSGQVQGITNSGAVVTALNINNNQLGNATSGYFSTSTATSGGLFGVATSASASTCAVSITGNDIRGITYNTTASAANTYFVNTATTFATFALNTNTFTNLTINSTGAVTFLGHSGSFSATSVSNINGNSIVTAYNKTGAGGTIVIRTSGSSTPAGAVVNFQNNIFSNMTFNGAITFTGYFDNDGGAPTKSITGNTFNNNNYGTGTVSQILAAAFNGNNTFISNNTITNQTTNSGSITCINLGASGTSSLEACANNTISNITSTGTGGSVVGITCASVGTVTNLNNNSISGLASTAASSVVALSITGGGTTTNVFKNTICDISGSNASSTVNGILISGGTTINLSNNRVGDLRTPAANAANPLIGINITGGTTINAYFNTVNLAATSSGALFGSSALSVSTTPTFDSRNNIFANTSTSTGAGLTVAYRRSGTTLTTYASTSDRNDFYATNIYTDGTNTFTTLGPGAGSYKNFVSARDANSISVNPPFLSTTCGNANFLKINTATATQLESGGANVSGITDDFENDIRQGNAGYTGSGTGPDIGADEFNGTPAAVCSGTPASTTINGAAAVCTGSGTTLSLSTTYTDLGITYAWFSGTTPGGPYPTALGTSATQATGNLTVTTYYIATITCTNSGLSFTTPQKTVTVNPLPTVSITPTPASAAICGTGSVALAASGASTYTWNPTTNLSPTTGANVTASPTVTTTYTVTGTDGNGCINTASQTVTVNPTIAVTATATPANVCTGANSQLLATASQSFTTPLANTYGFAGSGAGTYSVITGTTLAPSLTDDSGVGNLPIGFNFNYNGSNHTIFGMRTNGLIELDQATVALSGFSSNALASTANCIAPLWDDNNTVGGTMIYATTGAVGSRVLTAQWTAMHVGGGGSTTNPTIDVQIKLYEGSNKIEFIYGSTSAALAGTTASIGISGASGNFISVTPLSPANTSTTSTASENTGISSAANFPSGTVYTFTPAGAPVFTYAWSPATFLSNTNTANPVATAVTTTTTYTVTVTGTGGCTATANTTVTVSPLTAGSITLNGAQCANTNFTATANTTGGSPIYHYAWSDGVGGVYPDAQTITINKAAGSYTLSVTVTDGCGGSIPMTLPVTVNALPTITITPTPGTARICGTGSVSLAASGASTYTWSPTTNLTPTTGTPVTASPTATTTYTVSGTDGNGCVGTASQTVTVGPAVTVTATATPSTICSGGTSALSATASTNPALNYSVASLTPAQETPSGSFTNLISAGVYTPAPQGTATTPQDDGYFDGISLPFTFNFYGNNYTAVRISTNGNVQFGAITLGTGGNPGAASWTPQTIPTAGGFLDNFIAGPWMDQDMRTATGGTLRYFVNGTSPNQKFVISWEVAKVFNSTDANTSQIILNENGTIDVLLLGNGLVATTTKAIGIENATGSLGVAPPGRNSGAWTTAADEAWRFTPAVLNYAWTPATGLTPSSTVQNPTTPALTATTTYTVTATEAVSGCSGTNTATVTIGTANITASAGTGGTISPNGLTTINCGLNQTYTITASACYSIANVVVDGVSQGAVGTYTFSNVTAGSHTIVASFTLNTFTATVNAGANGTITPGSGTVNCGSNNTYTITANACYHIVDVTLNGVSQGAVGTLNVNNVQANYTVAATFAVNTYTATVNAGANGTITPASGTVNCGSNNTYTITADACYHIVDVTLNGVSQGAVGTLNVNNVQANYTVAATFAINTYTATVNAGANGTITPGSGTVNCGSNNTYTITANACYHIVDVTLNGVSQGAVGTLNVNNVQANYTVAATFAVNTYTITATSGANGSVTPAGATTVNCGSNQTYTITPDACYAVADVLVDGTSVGAVTTYTFTNVTATHTISATFIKTTYTINASAGAGGTINPSGAATVDCGDNATYTITPNACFSIANVVVDGISQGAISTYTFTNVTGNHTISATFSLNTYTITATSGANGTVTPAGATTVNCGSNQTYTITPAACYSIADVLVDGTSVGAVATYTFTNVTASHTISATFSLNTYTITATSGANGTVTPAGATTVNCGANQTYTITPDACYSIADVLVDGTSVGAVGTYTFTNVTASHTISATFSLNTYTITATSGANGTVTPAGATTVNCGSNQTYTITPAACYSIADVLVDGTSVGAVATYTFTNVTASHTISATFSLNTYTITATSGANGTVTPAGATTVNCGANQTYTITPDACYSIADVLVDGTSVGAVGTYTFTNVTASHTISATFSLNTYTITATSGANGTVTPAGATTVNCGANQTYTITPAACYSIADVLVDGTSVGAVATYTFSNVTASHTISATFSLNTYTITATSGANGTVTPAGATTVNCGANQAYTITPAACYAVSDVLVDGTSVGAVATYTFTNVTANHTISATFVQTTYTITATSGANGTVTPAGATTVNCGANQTYTITPAACYSIADVLVDGTSVGAVATYTFTTVTASHTISATFSLNTYTITATSGANGTVTPAGATTVNCGANQAYTITPAACYSIADVLVDGTSVGAVATYTFSNVTASHTISATFSLNTYTITATSGANGTVTPAGATTVNCGATQTYTITPDACYSIADVLVDGTSVGAVATYTFSNVTASHTISATFSLNTYTITATSGANGTVTPAGATTVNCGTNQTYTITPAACYSIADVLVDGTSVGAVATYTFSNVTASHTISATFSLNTYTITATSGANGTVTPAGATTVNCGANQTYTITPAACYSIADVLVDGTSVGAVATYTFSNVTASHTISATFSLNTYTITATSGANGTVTPAGATTVNCGSNQTYTITPAACYAVADVLVDGTSVGAVGTYTFTNVTTNHTISATFVQTTYTITATSGANGTVTPAGATTVNCGANQTYTITPAACYSIADVLVDGTSVGAVATYTFSNVTVSHTISATFSLNTYTITATSGANGTVTPAGPTTVNCGANQTYTITPAACYSIANVIVDGSSVGAVGTYTFTNVTANHTISATFSLNTYTITATSGANGTVTPAGATTVNCGANQTYTITPAACYAIANVIVDGSSVGAVGTYTFTNVTANHTISATFVQTTYTITATSGANGTVTPAGTTTVNCGANQTYTITPAACYSIANVIVDGSSVGAVGTYSFTNVTANHTISATFVQTTYTITATSGANGTVTPAGATTVNCGTNKTYTITPAACYSIANVIVDGSSVGAVGTYTFTNVTANHTISATFTLNTYTITATSGANGTVTPAGATTVNCGANATYTITANGGYAVQNVIVDGVSQGAITTYTFTNVTANHTISATFVATGGGFTITSSAGANGTISPNGVTNVASGGSQSYTITPATCYHVQDVLVDGSSVGAVTTYSFTNVTANHTISASFAINAALAAPTVTGPVNVCPYIGTGTQVTYTATSAGATGFTWVIPPTNVTIVSGQGTANLTVTFQNGFAAQGNKQLRVTATSSCGNSTQTLYVLVAQTPGTPGQISGNTNICPIINTAATYTYTINSVLAATSYIWTVPTGATIVSHPYGTGANDTAITVSFDNSFVNGTSITVASANQCNPGGSAARSLALTRPAPSTPGLISGPGNACPYMAPGGTAATYSIAPVANATSYTWTVPGGATITGQGTTTISFTYPSNFTSGTITVTATNGCGTSAARSLSVTKSLPSAPSNIDIIMGDPCPNRTYTYTIATTPANSTSVQWTVPAGGTIVSGQGTTSITVAYTSNAVNGNVTVQGVSNCGNSSIRSVAVRLPACAIERSAYTFTKGSGTILAPMEVKVFPNPSVSDFKLEVLTAGKETINVRVMDLQGRSIKTFTVMPYQSTTIGSDLKSGAYMMEVRQGNEVKTTKLIKF